MTTSNLGLEQFILTSHIQCFAYPRPFWANNTDCWPDKGNMRMTFNSFFVKYMTIWGTNLDNNLIYFFLTKYTLLYCLSKNYLWKSTSAACGLLSFLAIRFVHTYFFSSSTCVGATFLTNLSRDDTKVERVSLSLPHITNKRYLGPGNHCQTT